jgi:hypothetical protein
MEREQLGKNKEAAKMLAEHWALSSQGGADNVNDVIVSDNFKLRCRFNSRPQQWTTVVVS